MRIVPGDDERRGASGDPDQRVGVGTSDGMRRQVDFDTGFIDLPPPSPPSFFSTVATTGIAGRPVV